METIKQIPSCQLEKFQGDTNGGNLVKFTPQSNRPKPRHAPYTRPDTEKNPQRAKRNREFPIFWKIPYLCHVRLPRIAFGIGPPRPGFVRGAVFYRLCGSKIQGGNGPQFGNDRVCFHAIPNLALSFDLPELPQSK